MLSPAKVNLFLAVTGRRADGFHDLVSVVAPVAWGDELRIRFGSAGELATLDCDQTDVPLGEENLVLKAAAGYAAAAEPRQEDEAAGAPLLRGRGRFSLIKRIPIGAGLGGGSSNAATALKLLEAMSKPGTGLGKERLAEVAASLGSDCPLFLSRGPVVMRGRGEKISSLPPSAVRRMAGRRLVIFRAGFGVSTPWAYGRLAAEAPCAYLSADEAERRLADWIADEERPLEDLLFNSFERPVMAKFPVLALALDRLRTGLGLRCLMSGSGSACFALLPSDGGPTPADVSAVLRPLLGDSMFFVETAFTV